MKQSKRLKIEAAGFQITTTAEFLGLSPDGEAFIELKIALGKQLKKKRLKNKVTQVELAMLIGSSQSLVAMMEAGDASVTVDLLVKSLLALGTTREELAIIIST